MEMPGKTILLDDTSRCKSQPSYRTDEIYSILIPDKLELQELLDGFGKNFSVKKSLSKLNNCSSIHTLSSQQIAKDINSTDWVLFYKKHPNTNGFYRSTIPFINKTWDKAFVYIENVCGNKCGSGYLMILFKNNTTLLWEVKYYRCKHGHCFAGWK